jgi:hypothetical protein
MTDSLAELHEPFVEWVYNRASGSPLGRVSVREFSEGHGLDPDTSFELVRQCQQRGLVENCSTMGNPQASLTGSRLWANRLMSQLVAKQDRRGTRISSAESLRQKQ